MSPTSNSIHYHFSRSNQIPSHMKILQWLLRTLRKNNLNYCRTDKKKTCGFGPQEKPLFCTIQFPLNQSNHIIIMPSPVLTLCLCMPCLHLFGYSFSTNTHTHTPHEFCTQPDPTHLSCLGFSVSSSARPFLISCFKYSTHP